MAYMNQARKSELAPAIKAICKKYGVKASLSVHNYLTLCLNIKSSDIDFLFDTDQTYLQVNTYWFHEHFDGKAKEFLGEVISAMNIGNHNRSDSMTDYFDVGWYVHVNVGQWNKPYILNS